MQLRRSGRGKNPEIFLDDFEDETSEVYSHLGVSAEGHRSDSPRYGRDEGSRGFLTSGTEIKDKASTNMAMPDLNRKYV